VGKIRNLRPEDIPELVRLRRQVFHLTERPGDAALESYYERLFLSGPWRDDACPSLVYENAHGKPTGFIGVITRPMDFQGESLRAAVSTEFMVDPGVRGVGVELLAAHLRRGQDLSIGDRATDRARLLFEALGSMTVLSHSLYWAHPLRPSRFAAYQLEWRGILRAVRVAAWPVCTAFDLFATRVAPGRYRLPRPEGEPEELDVPTVIAKLPMVAGSKALRPTYTVESLRWLLRQLEEKTAYGRLEKVQVRHGAEGVIGWFVYFVKPGDQAEVVQMAALPGRHAEVLDHLLRHVARTGATVVSGRFDPLFRETFEQKGFRYSMARPWTVMHSRRPEVVRAFQTGNVFFSRLEGEWWMSF
jgi:hypothetical protein